MLSKGIADLDLSQIRKPKQIKEINTIEREIMISSAPPEISELFENLGDERNEAATFLTILAKSNELINEEKIPEFLEMISGEDKEKSLCALRCLYLYYKNYPAEKPLNLYDGELELINSLFPCNEATKIFAIFIRKDHEVFPKFVQMQGSIRNVSMKLKFLISNPEYSGSALNLVEAIFETNYFDDKLYDLFLFVVDNIQFSPKQKWGFKAIENYIKKNNSNSRAAEVKGRADANIFMSLTQSEESVETAASLMTTISYYIDLEVDFFAEFQIDVIFNWMLKKRVRGSCDPEMRMSMKEKERFSSAISKIIYLFLNSVDGEEALDIINWMLNTKIYATIMDNKEKIPAKVWNLCIALIGKMISFSTMSMFCYMNKWPVITSLVEVIANSPKPEDDEDNELISRALYRISAFLAIQNSREGFDDVLQESNIEVTRKIVEKSELESIYDPNEEEIVLPEGLREEVVELSEIDDGFHECINLFIERLDSLYGEED